MTRALEGRTVFITGASRGIGRAIAEDVARSGAHVALFATNLDTLRPVAEACVALHDGGRATVHALDVSDPAAVQREVEAALQAHGACHGLVNNAGITRDGLLMRMSDDDVRRVLAVNLESAIWFTRAVARPMMKQRDGSIVNVTSVVGVTGNAGQSNYAASKAGLLGFTKSVAKELGARGVRVNAVAPGYVETDMMLALAQRGTLSLDALKARTPLPRLGRPAEYAQLVKHIAENEMLNGEVIRLDGALRMAPR